MRQHLVLLEVVLHLLLVVAALLHWEPLVVVVQFHSVLSLVAIEHLVQSFVEVVVAKVVVVQEELR